MLQRAQHNCSVRMSNLYTLKAYRDTWNVVYMLTCLQCQHQCRCQQRRQQQSRPEE